MNMMKSTRRIFARSFFIAAAVAWHYSASAVLLPATRERAAQPQGAPPAAPFAAPAPAFSISLCAATIDTAPVAARAQASGRPADKLAADVATTIQTPTARGVLPYIVQFHGPGQEAWKQQIYNLQIAMYNYIPEHAFIVACAPRDVAKIAALPCVRWIGAYQPAYKLPPSLTRAALAAPAAVPAPRTGQTLFNQPCAAPMQYDNVSTTQLDVTVFVFTAEDKTAVMDLIKQAGGVAVAATATRLRARLPAAALETVARSAAVAWIERYLQPQIMNNVAVTGPLMNVTPVWDTLGLSGNGQIVGHADTGVDTGDLATMMPDFTNRIRAAFALKRSANNEWSDLQGHGTHTAGSILGNGSAWSNGLFRGVAYEAQLVHQSIGDQSTSVYPPSDLNELFIQAYTNGARIHSDSWGGGENGAYTAMAQDVDEFMWQHPDMLVVFSAGNGAGDYDRSGRIDPDSIAPPATAKNLLAIGAAESQRPPGAGGFAAVMYGDLWTDLFPAQVNTDFVSTSADGVHQGIAAFSGRGPTDDGRTKPDLVAPGTDIISCRSHMPQAGTLWGTGYGVLYNAASNDYTFSGGTSMAAPLVAGAAALVRQYFAERYLPAITNPSAALVKATLINGARSLTPGQYGYGATRELPPAPRPNNAEGWGQVDVAATLTNLTVYATN
ncbi:MAG: S8 family serine peptidase, partial [bacterium]|nr:S8 family serine peptidase [bacterium]